MTETDLELEASFIKSYTDTRVALISGALAGTAVDISLFPIDTVKTRLQSKAGFWKSGGFRGIYSGIVPVALGSAPTAAVFFVAYETTKNAAISLGVDKSSPIVSMMGATFGEISCCLLRVPIENVKQRSQVLAEISSYSIFRKLLAGEGIRGFYRGYLSTVIREVPFSFLQFPMWESFKRIWSRNQGHPVDPWQSSICGAVAGAIASGITTPLDVAKTRIMLAEKNSILASGSIVMALKEVYRDQGVRGLFAGIAPRMIWISIGGAVFLGVYDKMKIILTKYFDEEGCD